MSNLLWQGLGLSVMGMGLTFAALALIVVVIVLLQRLFSPPQPASRGREPEETLMASTPAQATREEEVVAAISVALAHFRSLGIGGKGLGAALETQPSQWWVRGRLQRPQRGRAVRMHSMKER